MRWIVPTIGIGTDDDPFRPDLPDHITWFAITIVDDEQTCVIESDSDLALTGLGTPCDPPPTPEEPA